MPLPFLKSSSASILSNTASTNVPPRPPSPLSAANATSRSSRSSRPSTSSTTSVRDRRPSTRQGQQPLPSQAVSSNPAPPIPNPPLSQSSRSLSSRLLRRRPSEKTSLARTPRLASVSVASDTDGPSEPLTGSTTVSDVFAGQQDAGLGGPIAARGPEVGRRRSESESGISGEMEDVEAMKWRDRLDSQNVWTGGERRGSAWSEATGSTTLNSPKIKGTFTALPPPPRQGNRGVIRPETIAVLPLQQEIEVPHLGLQKDLWGNRRSSDPAKISALLESIMPTQLPLDHPFEQRPPISFQRKSSTSTTNSSSGHSRAAGLGSSLTKDVSRFGDAPPLPVSSTGRTHFSPPRNMADGSPRSKRQDGGGYRRTTPPPRSSSRLNNAVDSFDTSFSPQPLSSFSGKKKLLASPTLLATAPRKSSLTNNTISPEHLWAYSQPLPKHNTRSSSFSTGSPLHAVPVPPVPSDMSHSPLAPLRYRSPRSSSTSRNSISSPSRPPRSAHRSKGLGSMSTAEETGVGSDEEGDLHWSALKGISNGNRENTEGKVSAVCVDLGDGTYKWEVIIRPGRREGNLTDQAAPIPLTTALRSMSAPSSAQLVNLSLSLDNPTGQLSFGSASPQGNATPRTNPTSRRQYTPASQTRPAEGPFIPHNRGNTFGATGTRKFGLGLTVEEVDGSPSPSPSTSTTNSLVSADIDRKFDRADTITPPPRMQTPPPMPSHPKINSTPKGFRSHRRTSSSGSRNWPDPAPSTPTSGRHSRDSSATYISSPSPRSTPRRTRLLSASQLNGGLYAPGTVDGLSEELEGLGGGR